MTTARPRRSLGRGQEEMNYPPVSPCRPLADVLPLDYLTPDAEAWLPLQAREVTPAQMAGAWPARRGGSRVEANTDRALLGASLAFAGATLLGSAVAIRDQLPGEPFGVSVPLSVPVGVLAGWGAGIAAPWPMPVAAVMAAAPAEREPDAFPGTVCAVIGLGCIFGTLIEPVTRRPRSWSPAAGLAIGLNVAASAALIAAGLHHRATARAPWRPSGS
jgi:hypothetical protein